MRPFLVIVAATLLGSLASVQPAAAQQAVVTLAPSAATTPMTGRLFVIFARAGDREPRFLAGSYGGSVPFFGVDVNALKPGSSATVGARVLGFPFDDLAHMPAARLQAEFETLRDHTAQHRRRRRAP